MKHFLGALKSKADVRDYKVAAAGSEFPESYTCANIPPVKNQKSVSSCVAHATAAILETLNTNETNEYIPLSTNFIYGMQGVALGRLQGGMYLRDACKIVKEYGDPTKETINGNTEQPKCTEELKAQLNDEVYKEANIFKVASYARCSNDKAIKHALTHYGPVLGSVNWHDKYTIKDDVIYFDKNSEHGRHAIMVYGWNEKGWLCQNSWGKKWNGNGRFIFPYDDKFNELWSFVDANNNDVVTPKNNRWLNYIYKFINLIVNFFSRFQK